MSASTRMFGRMAIWGIITTQRGAAFLTDPQMHPGRTDLHTFIALAPRGLSDGRDLGKMGAGSVRHAFTIQRLDSLSTLACLLTSDFHF